MAPSLVNRLLKPLQRRRAEPLVRVLMVCTGNICRSPTAEAVLRKRLADLDLQAVVEVDSAGTHAHEGSPPDPRSQRAAQARGYDLAGLRGRQIGGADYERFDLILAMDDTHLDWMARFAPPGVGAERVLFTARSRRFAGLPEVPDPYYGAPEGFTLVLDIVEDGVEGWLSWIRQRLDQKAAHGAGADGGAGPGFPGPKGD